MVALPFAYATIQGGTFGFMGGRRGENFSLLTNKFV